MISELSSCRANWLCPMIACRRCQHDLVRPVQIGPLRDSCCNSVGGSCRRWVNRLTNPSSVGVKKTFGGTDTASGSGLNAVIPIQITGISMMIAMMTAISARAVRCQSAVASPTLSTRVE